MTTTTTTVTAAAVSTVLIADDHPLVAHGIERVLAAAGDEFTVLAACHSGRETLTVATDRRPDLILLDVRLGDMNGADVCRRLGTEVPGAKTVVLTAFDDTGVTFMQIASTTGVTALFIVVFIGIAAAVFSFREMSGTRAAD